MTHEQAARTPEAQSNYDKAEARATAATATREQAQATAADSIMATADRAELLRELKHLYRTADTSKSASSTVRALAFVSADDGELTITTTDGAHHLTVKCGADVCGEGVAVVNAKALTAAVTALPAGCEVELIGCGSYLEVRAGRQFFNLPATPEGDYPEIPESPAACAIARVDVDTIAAMVQRVVYAITREDVRYALNGTMFEITAGEFRMVATDAHRMAHTATEVEHGIELEECIIPKTAVSQLGKLAAAAAGDVVISRNDDGVVFFDFLEYAGRRSVLAAVPVDGKFPQWRKVLPGPTPYTSTVNAGDALNALNTVGKFAPKNGMVSITGEYGALTITTTDPETGEAGQSIEAQTDGTLVDARVAITVNGRYLADYCKALPADVNVTIGMQETHKKVGNRTQQQGDNESQLRVWADDRDLPFSEYIVMPLRA